MRATALAVVLTATTMIAMPSCGRGEGAPETDAPPPTTTTPTTPTASIESPSTEAIESADASTEDRPDRAPAEGQATFASPEAAVEALREASEGLDWDALDRLFGPRLGALLAHRPNFDDLELLRFADELRQRSELFAVPGAEGRTWGLILDDDARIFPVPIERGVAGWFFDTDAGLAELRLRRIGANELKAIETCVALVDAQRAYALMDPDGDGVEGPAFRLASTPGARDGLHWVASDEELLEGALPPVGPGLARAWVDDGEGAPEPFHGYFYRMLRIPAADGVERDTDGFAFIAFPAKHGETGVMTLMIGADGVPYEFDLGPETTLRACSIRRYDPDGWIEVDESWRPSVAR